MLTTYELYNFPSKQGDIFISELQLRQNLLYACIEEELSNSMSDYTYLQKTLMTKCCKLKSNTHSDLDTWKVREV